jgi:starch-binding outer membrane protein, SusD/RagB family
MKKINSNIFSILLWAVLTVIFSSCMKDLLELQPTSELGSAAFWKTEDDALSALMGAYSAARECFYDDYLWDGKGEYQRTRGDESASAAFRKRNFNPQGGLDDHDNFYRELFGVVNHTNYVIENIRLRMLPNASATSRVQLEEIIAEARFLRGMAYHRLIAMWGDVPYIHKIIYSNAEVADITRTPIKQVKDSIIADFTYGVEKLPIKARGLGRAAKPAALAFRGKTHLYWASWNNFGWPELADFQPSPTEAQAAYTAAAADFKRVVDDFGLTLFKNGEPGEIDALGKADILPNYYHLFIPPANGDLSGEVIFAFTQGGIGSMQSEQLMRHISGRSHEGSQLWVTPRYEILDRYQSIITGDFVAPLTPMNPANNPGARTAPNSAINPQSFVDRDYRMKGTVMWDGEVSMGFSSLQNTGWKPFIYASWNAPITIDGVALRTYDDGGGCQTGVVYRKFLRNYPGLGRSQGDFYFPLMRLADVFLMYAEATNEVNGPQPVAVALVNKVRYRGKLPPLAPEKYATKEEFFVAIEQERIVELIGEGHRGFDLRRWRALERVWTPPNTAGIWRRDSHGFDRQRYFHFASERTYEQNYIFRIPPSERDRNPNLTQNTPWF